MSDYSVNMAKIFLLLVILAMMTVMVWSMVNVIQGYSTQVFNGVTLGLTLVSIIFLSMIFFRSTCDFS